MKNKLALLQVCRQIYSETAVIPYAYNTFDFSSVEWSINANGRASQAFYLWMMNRPRGQKHAVQRLVIDTSAARMFKPKDMNIRANFPRLKTLVWKDCPKDGNRHGVVEEEHIGTRRGLVIMHARRPRKT